MPGLPWVRLDSNIATHDKITALLAERKGTEAAWMYVCSLGFCGGHGTDGLVKFHSLPFIHGSKALAQLLVKHRLWEPDPEGWLVRNWADRQQAAGKTTRVRAAQSLAAKKTNCTRWHDEGCTCWQDGS